MSVRHEEAKRTVMSSQVMGVRRKGLTRRTSASSPSIMHRIMSPMWEWLISAYDMIKVKGRT